MRLKSILTRTARMVFCGIVIAGTSGAVAQDTPQKTGDTSPNVDTVPGMPEGKPTANKTPAPTVTVRASEVKTSSFTIQDKFRGIKNPPVDFTKYTRVGEKLVYLVKWKGIPGGTITLQVKRKSLMPTRGVAALTFEMHTQSNDFLSTFYKVDTRIRSFVDIQNGQSYIFRRNVNEGSRHMKTWQEFDYKYKYKDGRVEPVSIYGKEKKGQMITKTPRPIPGAVQDPLSLAYYMRSLVFKKPGDYYEVLLGGRKRTDIVTIRARKFTKLRLKKLGTYHCVIVEPKGEVGVKHDNLAVAEGTATVWLEKNTGIPLRISVKVPIGHASATLISEKNTTLKLHEIKK